MSALTDRLDEMLAHADKAADHIADICEGKARWVMRIPAEPERDSDFVMSAPVEDVPTLVEALRAVLELTFASDDGAEYAHRDGCTGEPECPACWAETIRLAIASALGVSEP